MRSIIASVSARVRVFSALRYRNFRLYWFGSVGDGLGAPNDYPG